MTPFFMLIYLYYYISRVTSQSNCQIIYYWEKLQYHPTVVPTQMVPFSPKQCHLFKNTTLVIHITFYQNKKKKSNPRHHFIYFILFSNPAAENREKLRENKRTSVMAWSTSKDAPTLFHFMRFLFEATPINFKFPFLSLSLSHIWIKSMVFYPIISLSNHRTLCGFLLSSQLRV